MEEDDPGGMTNMKEKEESQGRRKLNGKEEDQVRDGVIRGGGREERAQNERRAK